MNGKHKPTAVRKGKMNIKQAIKSLQNKRKIFHSEDDLKFALSQELQKLFPPFHIRLERPVEIEMRTRGEGIKIVRAPIDILLIDKNGRHFPIELKYKTKLFKATHDDEEYHLTNHGACDIGRFSFRKDVFRIEQYLLKSEKYEQGFVLIITNETDYFKNILSERKLDSHFSFHDGCILKNEDDSWNYDAIDLSKYYYSKQDSKWKYKSSEKVHWTCKGEKFYTLPLSNEYQISWKKYSKIDDEVFKYCLITVKNK